MDDGNLMWVDPYPCKVLATASDIPLHGRECGNAIVELHVVASANVYINLFISLFNTS